MKKKINRSKDFGTKRSPASYLTVQVGNTKGKHPLFVWETERGFDFHAQLLRRNKKWPEEGEEISGIAVYIEGEDERTALAKALRFTADVVEELVKNHPETKPSKV